MDLTLKRNKCKKSFDRNGVDACTLAPRAEVHAVIDKVEVTADRFKLKKKCKRLAIAYVIILALCMIGCAVRHHMKAQWRHGSMGGPQGGHMMSQRSYQQGRQMQQGKGPQPMGPTPVHPTANLKAQEPQVDPNTQNHNIVERMRDKRPHQDRWWKHHNGEGRRHHWNPTPEQNTPNPAPRPDVLPNPARPEIHQPIPPPSPEASLEKKVEAPIQAPTIIQSQAPSFLGAPAVDLPAKAEETKPDRKSFRSRQGRKFFKHMMKAGKRWMVRKMFRKMMMKRLFHKMMMRRFSGRMFGHHQNFEGKFARRHGFGKWRRHHKKGKFCKFIIFFLVIPLCFFLCYRCQMKKIQRRVKALLEIENRLFREKYGCEWATNWRLTELSLRRVGMNAQSQMQNQVLPTPQLSARPPVYAQNYPVPHQTANPFGHAQEIPAPLFTEESARLPQRYAQPRGYQRVSLDDSSVGYH